MADGIERLIDVWIEGRMIFLIVAEYPVTVSADKNRRFIPPMICRVVFFDGLPAVMAARPASRIIGAKRFTAPLFPHFLRQL